MNHKRGKPKKARAGCLLCKPHKLNGENKLAEVSKTGFAKIRADRSSRQDMRDEGGGCHEHRQDKGRKGPEMTLADDALGKKWIGRRPI